MLKEILQNLEIDFRLKLSSICFKVLDRMDPNEDPELYDWLLDEIDWELNKVDFALYGESMELKGRL